MRIVVVACLLLAACERVPASRQDPPAPSPTPMPTPTTPKPPTSDDLARLASELQRLTPDDTIYLAELGWFSVKHYLAYEGRNPRTGERVSVPEMWALFFRAHPNVEHALNSEPPETIGDPTRHLDDDRTVRHAVWADPVAQWIRAQVIATGTCVLAGVGTFGTSPAANLESASEDKPWRQVVTWGTADVLQGALGNAR